MYNLQEFLNETILYISGPQSDNLGFHNFFSLDYRNIYSGGDNINFYDCKEYSVNRLLIRFKENHRRLGFLLQKRRKDFDTQGNGFYIKKFFETRPTWFKKLQLPNEIDQKILENIKSRRISIRSQGSINIDFWIEEDFTIKHWLQAFLYNLYVEKLS